MQRIPDKLIPVVKRLISHSLGLEQGVDFEGLTEAERGIVGNPDTLNQLKDLVVKDPTDELEQIRVDLNQAWDLLQDSLSRAREKYGDREAYIHIERLLDQARLAS